MFATVGRHPADRIPALLDVVGLGDRGDDRYRTYSLGMKQRLGIAAALLGDPALLILDEPANGLDPQGVHEMRGLVGSLAHSGRTVLVSSHDLSELEQLCDWLVMIEAGRSRVPGPGRRLPRTAPTTALGVRARARRRRSTSCAPRSTAGGHAVDVGGRARSSCATTTVAGDDLAADVNRTAHRAGIVLVELSPCARRSRTATWPSSTPTSRRGDPS